MYYFAYGSNLSKRQMRERCPDNKPEMEATLPNYKLVFVGWSRKWRGGVATIKRFTGSKVHGALYQISEACLRRLDKFEGYHDSNNRLNVIVFNEDNEPVEAFTYIKSGRLEETPPSREYVSIIQQGYRDWEIV